jgi:hypothetical protein
MMGGCRPRPSTTSTVSFTASSPVSSTTTPSSHLFPMATNCPSLAEYSSACACLEPPKITEYAWRSPPSFDKR